MALDPMAPIRYLDRLIPTLDNADSRYWTELFREHLLAEVEADMERIMATNVADPQYHFFGEGRGDYGPKGYAAVCEHYRTVFSGGYNKLQYDIDRFWATPAGVYHEGVLHVPFHGSVLQLMQLPADTDRWYCYSYRQAAIFPAGEGGRFAGEDVYTDGAMDAQRIRPLNQAELPPGLTVPDLSEWHNALA